MLAKRIVCSVKPASKPAFSRAQEAWRGLERLPGFSAQFGGFSSNEAHIIGLWVDAPSYESFMSTQHDGIAAAQQRSYDAIRLAMFTKVFDIAASASGLSEAVAEADHVRLAEYRIRPAPLGRVLAALKHARQSAVRVAGGMLATSVWQGRDDESRFLEISLWSTRQTHAVQPGGQPARFGEPSAPLRLGAEFEVIDEVSLTLIPQWSVVAHPVRTGL